MIVARRYEDNVYVGEVDFDKIESFYFFDNDYIVCPRGKYHPHYFYDGTYSTLNLSSFKSNGDWELKCYYHSTGYFLVFYLMNGKSQFFYKKSGGDSFTEKELHQEIYDFKLTDGSSNVEYSMAYLVKEGDWIKLKGTKYTFNNDGVFKNDCGGEVYIMPASNYTRGCFEQDYDIFYFLTYTNNSDFSCGYFASGDGIDKLSVSQYSSSIITASDSPLEFVDQVEIKEIKFIYSYKYAYYTIYNPITDKTYHGIIDTKTNSIVFNTEEEILTFVQYNVISMVAITSTGAYQICVIKQDNACIDSYGCTTQNFNYILYTEGNKCQDSCENGKILLIRENFCGDSCDESIYMLVIINAVYANIFIQILLIN